jgi:hypothetical protein
LFYPEESYTQRFNPVDMKLELAGLPEKEKRVEEGITGFRK